MKGILAEVGYADACLCRELPDGSLELVDGHLRAETTPDQDVPVLVLDVTEAEADKILATLDPLAAMATADGDKLGALLADMSTDNDAVQAMLDGLAKDNEVELAKAQDDTYTGKIVSPIYEAKGEEPPLAALVDRSKTDELIGDIEAADIGDDVKGFLRQAAERHTGFHFRQIAEFYCHAPEEVQNLMERSGLVIIDFDKAIEYGFVHLTEQLGAIADKEGFCAA